MGNPGATDIVRRIVNAYAKLHPSMFTHFIWRMNKDVMADLAKEVGMEGAVNIGVDTLTIFNIPVEIVETDEILLVLKA